MQQQFGRLSLQKGRSRSATPEHRFSPGDQEFRFPQENLAATFGQYALALPSCKCTAGRKRRYVCSSRQILVSNVNLDASRTSFANPGGETDNHVSDTSRCIVRTERDIGCDKPRDILCDGN